MRKILVVEDHPAVSIGIMLVVTDSIPDCEIVEVQTFPDAVKVLESSRIDLIILDVMVPGGGGAKMIPLLRRIQPEVKILISSGISEKHHAVTFIREGANGFVSKNAGDGALREALGKVLTGKRYLSDVLQDLLVHSLLAYNDLAVPMTDSLSPRELEVMGLLMEGKQNTEISKKLRLKLSTVSAHKKRIMLKIGANNLVDLCELLANYPVVNGCTRTMQAGHR